MPPLSHTVPTHTQALTITKPAGGSNSAKAQLPKFVVTLEETEREAYSQTSGMPHSSQLFLSQRFGLFVFPNCARKSIPVLSGTA